MLTGIILAVLLSCATTASADKQIVDSAGLEIPNAPKNQPYVMINGFPEYRVGPGDILEIIMVQGDSRRVENARILPDSSISFGILNKVKIGGLALSAAETKLIQTLGEYVRKPTTAGHHEGVLQQLRVSLWGHKYIECHPSGHLRSSPESPAKCHGVNVIS